MNKCEQCVWVEQCGSDFVCEYFDPIDPELEDAVARAEYELDLLERHQEYIETVKEQNT